MDIEKTMQFLLEQQARFDARQAEYEARQADYESRQAARQTEYEARQAEYEARQTDYESRQTDYESRQTEYESRQAEFVERHEQARVQINDTLVRVTASQERTSAILATLAERHVELAGAQKVTEQNLNALISTVERHIASHI